MATYSDRLRLELMTTGEFSGTWGDRTNVNMGTILEQAIAGLKTVTMTDADKTLTTATGNAVSQGGTDYTDDEARYAILLITSSEDLTSSRNVVIPAKEKIYIVKNGTTGSQQITVKTSAGTGIVIPNGKTMVIYCDGTDTQSAVDNFPSGTTIAGSEIATTTTGQTIQNKTIESSTLDSTTVGATTASTGAFTTLTSSSTTTLDGTTIPSSKTLVDTDSTQTLTNKTLTSPYINEILHEGTENAFETTLAFADPTADRTITFPDSDGTVSLSDTTYTAGTGLTLDGTEFDVNVSETAQTTAAETVTTTANRTYAVQVDSSDNLVVNVPWVDTDTQNTYTAGTGLELTGGEFSVNLGTATANTATQASVGTTDGRTYLVQTDSDGDLVVNVPWENTEGTDTTYSSGTGLTLTGTTFNVNVEGTVSSATPEDVTTTADRTYQVQHNSSDNLVVNVPWSDNDTTYSTATSSTLGLVKLGDDTEQATGANTVTSTASRTYAVQVNSSDQLVVNVPWVDNDENTEYTAGSGLTLTGTEFSADFDGSFTSLTSVPSVLANANNTSLTFEGSSEDDFETVLNISNPTADRTITFPDLTGTVSLITATETLTNKTLTSPYVNEILHEGTADDFETTLAFTDPTADRTITFPDAGGTVALTSDIGTLGSQASDSVTITGGTINGTSIGGTTKGYGGFTSIVGTSLTVTNSITVSQLGSLSLTYDGNGSSGSSLTMMLDSDSPAANDKNAEIAGRGRNSSDEIIDYSKIQFYTDSPTNSFESGRIEFRGYYTGTPNVLFFDLEGNESVFHQNYGIRVENDNSSGFPATLTLYSNSSSPADGDQLGRISFDGNDSGLTKTTYARIYAVSTDVTNASEDGELNFQIFEAGSGYDEIVLSRDTCRIYSKLYLDGGGTYVDVIKDEDDMSSNSATALATQQSIKAYVDTEVASAGAPRIVGSRNFVINTNGYYKVALAGIDSSKPLYAHVNASGGELRVKGPTFTGNVNVTSVKHQVAGNTTSNTSQTLSASSPVGFATVSGTGSSSTIQTPDTFGFWMIVEFSSSSGTFQLQNNDSENDIQVLMQFWQ